MRKPFGGASLAFRGINQHARGVYQCQCSWGVRALERVTEVGCESRARCVSRCGRVNTRLPVEALIASTSPATDCNAWLIAGGDAEPRFGFGMFSMIQFEFMYLSSNYFWKMFLFV